MAQVDLVNALVVDAKEDPAAPAAKVLADVPVVAAVVVPKVKDGGLRVVHQVAAPAALVVVVPKAGLLVEDGLALTPNEC